MGGTFGFLKLSGGTCEFIKPWVGTSALAFSIHSIPVEANKGHFQVPTKRFGETNAI